MKNHLESDWTRRVQDRPNCTLRFDNYIPIRDHSVSLGTDPPLANHNPAIFSVPPTPPPPQGTEKLNKSPPGRQKALIIPTCCTCLTITLILISEQPIKHVLIPSYVIQVIYQNQNVTKLNKIIFK